MQPDPTTIKNHILTFFEGHEYGDGKVEISTLTNSSYFDATEIETAVEYAAAQNRAGKNVYISGALFDPEAAPFGRSSDSDFYASCMAWADIDEPHDPEALKALYTQCKPTYAIVTARTPHRRIQLWWKLQEAVTDPDILREALEGIADSLGGDHKVKNITSLMRLAGTVNYPTEKKRALGRVTELTEFVNMNAPRHTIEAIIESFPVKDAPLFEQATPGPEKVAPKTEDKYHIQGFDVRLKDGRESYMSDLVYATILDYAEEHGAWPDEAQVLEACWPVYERKVIATVQGGLDKEGRGVKAMRQKIRSKLRLFTRGRIKGHEEPLKKQHAKSEEKPSSGQKEGKAEETRKSFDLLYADDIKPTLETNDFIEDLLCENQFSVIYGESNCGKTFFMLDLAMHVALGRIWRGKRVNQGGVIYAALEGGQGTKNRIVAFKKHHNIESGIPLAVIASSVNFLDPEGDIAALVSSIEEARARIGEVKLIVIDTLARAIFGGDENSSVDMGRLVANADLLREKTGAHVSFIHHSGKDAIKGARGHSSLRAAVDTEIEISRKDETSPSVIKIVKQREIAMLDAMGFALKSIELGINNRLKPVTSCVVIDAPVDESIRSTSFSAMEEQVFDAFLYAIDRYGFMATPEKDMPQLRVITYESFYNGLVRGGYKELYDKDGNITAKNIKSATNSVRAQLRKKGKISYNKDYLWLLS